jgi:hypothetical protein
MTLEQIRELVQSSEQVAESEQTFQKSEYGIDSGESLFFVMYYLYKSELKDEIPNPSRYAIDFLDYTNGLTGDYSDDGLGFFFSNNKLVGVVTYFNHANIINELQKKYGKSVSLKFPDIRSEGRVWLDNKRYIVWSRSDLLSEMGVEFVTYLDAEWSREICKKCIQNYRKEKQQEKSHHRSRLD